MDGRDRQPGEVPEDESVETGTMVDRVHEDPTGVYRYADTELNASHACLLPSLRKILASETPALRGARIFDLSSGQEGHSASSWSKRDFQG